MWLGKYFNLKTPSIGNTPNTNIRVFAITILMSRIPLNPKVIDRMCGFMLGAAAPHKGTTCLLRSWYLTRWSTRFLPRAYLNMSRALIDLAITASSTWFAKTTLDDPWTYPPIAVDAAQCPEGYRIGIFSPLWGSRTLLAPQYIRNQQTAELYALDAATRWATRLGVNTITLIGDNLGALHLLNSMRPPVASHHIVQIIRRILNRARWSQLRAQLLWVPSGIQPADPISRCDPNSEFSTTEAILDTCRRWHFLDQN
jgi:hypothetical protein